MPDDNRKTPIELYYVPIEALDLTEKTITVVKRTGITTVGDCVDFFFGALAGGSPGRVPFGFLDAMFQEIKPKLIERGYWSLKYEEDEPSC